MEEIQRRDRTPEEQQTAKRRTTLKYYDMKGLCETLGITEEHVLLSGRKLPPGWERAKLFGKEVKPNISVSRRLEKLMKQQNSLSREDLLRHYKEVILDNNYQNTHFHCLFVRYARKHFRIARP